MAEYREIENFPGYRVGDDGSVWSRRTPKSGLLRDQWKRLKGCIDKLTGYVSVQLRRDGRSHREAVHRLVLLAFVGPCPEGCEACHFPDSDRTRNDLGNLRWDTRSANQNDKLVHGTHNRGSRQGQAKLVEADIPEIFSIRREIPDATIEDIGIFFGVAKSTIQSVLEGRNWGWLSRRLKLISDDMAGT